MKYSRLESLNFSEAQKRESGSYEQPDLVIQFHQNTKGGFTRGERYNVASSGDGQVTLLPIGGGDSRPLPLEAADRFEVYQRNTVEFAIGDKVRFSLGGKAIDGKRKISNGRLDQVKGFDTKGNLVLKSGMTVSRDYGHFDLGYVITSHAAQGKDCDVAIAAIGSQSLPAVHAKQFYVTVSRGRKNTAIYVEDKEAVRRAIQNAGEQLSATELVRPTGELHQSRSRDQTHHRRAFLDRIRTWWQTYFPKSQAQTSQAAARSSVPSLHATPELTRS